MNAELVQSSHFIRIRVISMIVIIIEYKTLESYDEVVGKGH